MQAVLRVLQGPSAGRKVWLRPGQIIEVGRTDGIDLALPHDDELADVHFSLELDRAGCRLRDLSERGIHVNGELVVETLARDGDRIFAGHTEFALLIHADHGTTGCAAHASRGASHDDLPQAAQLPAGETLSVAEICQQMEIDLPAPQPGQPTPHASELARRLVDEGRSADALRFVARALPKTNAIEWSCRCLQGKTGASLPGSELELLTRTDEWLKAPSDESRRALYASAEPLRFETPASLTALAAFWSAGSLAPAGLPEVPCAAHLCAKAVSGALLLAAARVPAQMSETHRRFVELGLEMLARQQHDK